MSFQEANICDTRIQSLVFTLELNSPILLVNKLHVALNTTDTSTRAEHQNLKLRPPDEEGIVHTLPSIDMTRHFGYHMINFRLIL